MSYCPHCGAPVYEEDFSGDPVVQCLRCLWEGPADYLVDYPYDARFPDDECGPQY